MKIKEFEKAIDALCAGVTIIRRTRKAWKRKFGVRLVGVYFKIKNRAVCFTPTMRKNLRRTMTELFRQSLMKKDVH